MGREKRFEHVVIGAGSGGLTVAIGLARAGKEVALIEGGEIGGDCTNRGCVPSKALLHAAKVGMSGKEGMAYVKSKIDQIREEESPEVLEEDGITVIKGWAKFVGERGIHVASSQELVVSKNTEVQNSGVRSQKKSLSNSGRNKRIATSHKTSDSGLRQNDDFVARNDGVMERNHRLVVVGKKIVVATGSRARRMDISGLPEKKLLTNENVFDLDDIPRKLVIIGTGPISCELAYAFARLGSEVHVLYRGQGILNKEDPTLSTLVLASLKKAGVKFHWQADEYRWEGESKRNQKTGERRNTGTVQIPDKNSSSRDDKLGRLVWKNEKSKRDDSLEDVDYVLLAVGREAVVEGLELERTGVDHSEKGIVVDSGFHTSAKKIWAIGDVLQGPNFTHVANAQGRAVLKQLLTPDWIPWSPGISQLPWCTYTQPEIASVGDANFNRLEKRLGKDVLKISFDLSKTDRGKLVEVEGRVTVWAERMTGKILRASVVAPHAGEMIGYWVVAINQGISLWKLQGMMLPYPTLNEANRKIADEFVITTLQQFKSEMEWFIGKLLRTYGAKVGVAAFWIGFLLYGRWLMTVNDWGFWELAERFESFLRTSPWAVVTYLLVYSLRSVIVFPAVVLTVLAGVIWGLGEGFVWSLLGGTASVLIPFFATRWFWGEPDEGFSQRVRKYLGGLRKRPFETVLIMRLLYLPYDIVTVAAASAGMPFKPFIAATLLGNIGGTLTYVALGDSLEGDLSHGEIGFDWTALGIGIVVLIITLGISRYLKWRRARMD